MAVAAVAAVAARTVLYPLRLPASTCALLSSARLEQPASSGGCRGNNSGTAVFSRRSAIVSVTTTFLLISAPSLVSAARAEETDEADDEEGTAMRIFEVTNYHVVAKLATDMTGRKKCKISLLDADNNTVIKEGRLVGFDAAYDLAVLKVDIEGGKLKPALLGTSQDLLVGQSCFAIGNPYGYEHTLTAGVLSVVSGLGREIPSPSGQPILGAIQTDAAINPGNSGGPLLDSHGHVIGVNTATFTRKGTGLSSGVNFAVPIDTVRRIVPDLIAYGSTDGNRF
ncbi:protease Do-like 5, chloroplastic isoform X3 [Nymphaea colorata]|uniref:protease Do-like 5, chloroplastic isoform X3 n=1 Tax=Nymphaea colorata TaxID=210225 RepID=UPI00129EAF88|nr:protease Do-like 5, chloroplastic isoform X3 [Nymphaea colorata]